MLVQEAHGQLVMLGKAGTPSVEIVKPQDVVPVILGRWYPNLGKLASDLVATFSAEHPDYGNSPLTAFAEAIVSLFVSRLYADTSPQTAAVVQDLARARTPHGNRYAKVLITAVVVEGDCKLRYDGFIAAFREAGAERPVAGGAAMTLYAADFEEFLVALQEEGVTVESDADRSWCRLKEIFQLLWLAVYLAPKPTGDVQGGNGPTQTRRTAR